MRLLRLGPLSNDPFALSLSKGECLCSRFDKLSTNG